MAVKDAVTEILDHPQRAGEERLLIVVDQFEELFTFRGPTGERRGFVEQLLEALKVGGLRLVITLRADFYGEAMALSTELSEELEGRVRHLGPLQPAGLEDAIVEPAALLRVEFDRVLVERMLEDCRSQPGHLPLLEFALTELWHRRQGDRIGSEDYDLLGGLEGAVELRAEEALREISPEKARKLLTGLVQVAPSGSGLRDTRKYLPLPSDAEGRGIVDQLSAARLVVTDAAAGDDPDAPREPRVTLAHEALIDAWPKLRRWVEEDREFLYAHQRLQDQVGDWKRVGKEALIGGERLREAERLLAAHPHLLSEEERAFVTDSRRDEDRWAFLKRLAFMIIALLGAAVLVAAVVAGVGWWIAKARRLAAQAEQIRYEQPNLLPCSVLLAADSLRRFETVGMSSLEADQALRRGLALLPTPAVAQPLLHSGEVEAVAVSGDGRYVASASGDGSAYLWDVESGSTIHQIGRAAAVRDVALSCDGRYLATASDDETAQLWDVSRQPPELLETVRHRGSVVAVAISPDGSYLATASDDETVRILCFEDRIQTRLPHDAKVLGLAFSPGGKMLATVSEDRGVRVWKVATWELLPPIHHLQKLPTETAFSPDGRYLVTADKEPAVHVLDLESREVVADLPHDQTIKALAFHPDLPNLLATGTTGGQVRIWNVKSGREKVRLSHEGPVVSLAFSPDGRFLATAGVDRTARVWQLTFYEQPPEHQDQQFFHQEVMRIAHQDTVTAVAFDGCGRESTPGRRLITASLDHTVRAWAMPAPGATTPTGGFDRGALLHNQEVCGVEFRRPAEGHGYSLTTTTLRNKEAHRWRGEAKAPVSAVGAAWTEIQLPGDPLKGSCPQPGQPATSRHGWYEATFDEGREAVLVRDLRRDRRVARMKHPEVGQIPLNQKIRAVAFSRDERFLATAGNDHSARLWPLRAEDLIAEACCRLGLPQARELPGQCQSYVAGLDPNVLCPPDLPPPPFCPARRP